MQQKYKFGSLTHGMGDILILTAVVKHVENCIIQLPKNKERYRIFFDQMCEVEITNGINPAIDIGYGHYATTKLRAFFGKNAEHMNNLPLVKYEDDESNQWAEDILKNIERPYIFTPTCSSHWAKVRNIPSCYIDEILNGDGTPIVCCSKDNKIYNSKIKYQFEDLDLKKYICLMRKVKKYIGANTGDMHLAVAVGASCKVYQPQKNNLFDPKQWCYYTDNMEYIEF